MCEILRPLASPKKTRNLLSLLGICCRNFQRANDAQTHIQRRYIYIHFAALSGARQALKPLTARKRLPGGPPLDHNVRYRFLSRPRACATRATYFLT